MSRSTPVRRQEIPDRSGWVEHRRDKRGFTGGITIVTDFVREARLRTAEKFVPLHHPPGHAQVDFGEAIGGVGGVQRKLHVFFMSLPYSDAFFIKAYPAETTGVFLDGEVSAFAFFGGVPQSILYDNTKLAVAASFDEVNTRLEAACFNDQDRKSSRSG